MYRKIKTYMGEHGMIEAGDMVCAGVSGGGDSMAMLSALKRYREEIPFSLCAVHVNHGIRGEEAMRDENLVKDICEKWKIPLFSYHYPVPELAKEWKSGLEETGRLVRKEAFSRAASEFEKMACCKCGEKGRRLTALAHNENDLAETVIHNLCRGTGLKGLCTMQPVSGSIIRPVLCLKKEEILKYLEENQVPYETDSTNLSDAYTRNKLRHKVLPLLEREINSGSIRHIAESAELVSEAEIYIKKQSLTLLDSYREYREEGIFLPDAFWREDPALVSYGVLDVLGKLAGKRKYLGAVHVKTVKDLSGRQVGRKVNLPYGLTALRIYGGIYIGQEKKERKEVGTQKLLLPGTTFAGEDRFTAKIFSYGGQKIEEKTYTKWLDYDKIKQELSIRTRQPGDFLAVNDSGSQKKLNRYFIDEKIPAPRRDEIWLVAEGTEILWVVGGRINSDYKITSRTRRVLEIQYQGGKNHE